MPSSSPTAPRLPLQAPFVLAVAAAVAAAALGWVVAETPGLAHLENPFTLANAGALALALALCAALLARPGLGLGLLAAFVYLNLSQILVREHGLPSLLQLLAIPIALAAARGEGAERFRRLPRLALAGLLAAYCGVLLLSTLAAWDRNLADDRLFESIKSWAIFALVAVLAATPRRLFQGAWTIVLAGALLGGLGIFQVVTGDFSRQFWGFARVKDAHIWGDVFEKRIAGPLGDPNFFAQILLILVPVGLTLAAESRDLRARALALGATGLILGGAVLTYSRGGALALGFVLLLMLVSFRIRPRRVGLGLLAVVLVLLLMPPEFLRRLGTISEVLPGGEEEVLDPDSSFQERKLYALTAWAMFLDYPLLGVGAGNYTVHFDRYADEVGFSARDYEQPGEVHYPHNLYLEIAAETGLVGLAVFAAAVAAAFVSLRRARSVLKRRGEIPSADLARAFEIALAGYLVSSVFLHGHFQRYLWLLFGFAAALRLMAGDGKGERGERELPV
jgi:putative inorganic carbon (HCO3(-)) transporter